MTICCAWQFQHQTVWRNDSSQIPGTWSTQGTSVGVVGSCIRTLNDARNAQVRMTTATRHRTKGRNNTAFAKPLPGSVPSTHGTQSRFAIAFAPTNISDGGELFDNFVNLPCLMAVPEFFYTFPGNSIRALGKTSVPSLPILSTLYLIYIINKPKEHSKTFMSFVK